MTGESYRCKLYNFNGYMLVENKCVKFMVDDYQPYSDKFKHLNVLDHLISNYL